MVEQLAVLHKQVHLVVQGTVMLAVLKMMVQQAALLVVVAAVLVLLVQEGLVAQV